jgi:hypothetical protein
MSNKHLYEAAAKMNPTKLDAGTRRKANAALAKAGLDGNKRFPKVANAMNAAWKALDDFGLEPDASNPYISGDGGSFSQGLRWTNEDDPYSPTDIANSVLYIQWAKLETGHEVVGYLS